MKKGVANLGLKVKPFNTNHSKRSDRKVVFNSCWIAEIERIAVEIRHLQRSEVDEVVEGFPFKKAPQLPHKKIPFLQKI